jgi:hypothetical protein
MLDYIRYPGPPADDNGTTLLGYAAPIVDSFKELTGRDPFSIANNDREWVDHRAGFVTQTIREIRAALPKRGGQELEISVCTGGLIHDDLNRLFRDWRTWIAQGLVDTLCPMLYFKPEQVGRETRAIRQTLEGESGYNLYSALCIKYDLLNTPELLHQGYAEAMEGGADGVCIYRADGLENASLWGEIEQLGKSGQTG